MSKRSWFMFLWVLVTSTLHGGNGTVMWVPEDVFEQLVASYYLDEPIEVPEFEQCEITEIYTEDNHVASLDLVTSAGEMWHIKPADQDYPAKASN